MFINLSFFAVRTKNLFFTYPDMHPYYDLRLMRWNLVVTETRLLFFFFEKRANRDSTWSLINWHKQKKKRFVLRKDWWTVRNTKKGSQEFVGVERNDMV